MTHRTLIATESLVAVSVAMIAAVGFVVTERAAAAEPHIPDMKVTSSDATARFLPLGIGKSVVIELPRDIKDVLVSDPKIANAIVRTSRKVYIMGVAIGQTNIFFFDADGQQIGGLDIAVTRDLNGVRAALKRDLPGEDVDIEGVGDGVLLSGNVATPMEAQSAFDIASRLVGGGVDAKVVNHITVRGHDQVMLKVTVAEMDRTVIKQLGINLNGSAGVGSAVVNFNNTNPLSVNGPLSTSNIAGTVKSVTATLQAMEEAGVVHTLAEPTLTAISGESASFLAGGKFPYPTPPTSANGAPGFAWQTFGVSLTFTPVVLSEGRISLKVTTEVSELDPDHSVTIAGTTVPGLTTRNVNTTLEIPSGGSLAMAGMIQEQTKQNINGLPGLMNVPILGTLFKSRDYLNSQTELVVIVTPYITRAVAQSKLSRPDDGFADASDPATILLGNFNRIYGVPATSPPKSTYYGNIGFIVD